MKVETINKVTECFEKWHSIKNSFGKESDEKSSTKNSVRIVQTNYPTLVNELTRVGHLDSVVFTTYNVFTRLCCSIGATHCDNVDIREVRSFMLPTAIASADDESIVLIADPLLRMSDDFVLVGVFKEGKCVIYNIPNDNQMECNSHKK